MGEAGEGEEGLIGAARHVMNVVLESSGDGTLEALAGRNVRPSAPAQVR